MVRDGWIIVIPLAGVIVVCLILAQWMPSQVWSPIAITSGVLGALIGLFFRNPNRTIPAGDGLVISGADGKVVAIE